MLHLLLFLHVISVVVWVGGMFLAYVAVRPAAVEVLDPPQRLKLWAGIFRRFFPWVKAAVILILGTGFTLIHTMGRAPAYVVIMMMIGLIMTAIFIWIYRGPWGRLQGAVAAGDWPAGGAALAEIRRLIGVNLALGLINIAVALLGRGIPF